MRHFYYILDFVTLIVSKPMNANVHSLLTLAATNNRYFGLGVTLVTGDFHPNQFVVVFVSTALEAPN